MAMRTLQSIGGAFLAVLLSAGSSRAEGGAVAASGAEASAERPEAVGPSSRGRAAADPAHPVGRSHRQTHRTASSHTVRPSRPCTHEPVTFERGIGGASQPIALTSCAGAALPTSIEQLSLLARPMSAAKPAAAASGAPPLLAERDRATREWLPGVKLMDTGLVLRLQRVVDHFRAKKVTVVSGYRPASVGSFHQSAKALDFRLEGVTNEALVAFCRKLDDTGCGYYPNSSFIHMDVRPGGSGHVYWIDSSGPGESPHYVSSWPPPRDELGRELTAASPPKELAADEHTHEDLFGPRGVSQGKGQGNVGEAAPRPDSDDPFRP